MQEILPTLTIVDGDYSARVSTFGGGLAGAHFRDKPLLVGYPEGDMPPLSSGVILAPWPNRVAEGTFSHAGQEYRLHVNEPGRANAIHGFVAESTWQLVHREGHAVTLETEAGCRPGWPWSLTLRVTWTVQAGSGVRLDAAVTNNSQETCPFGLGWHPYLSALGAPLDSCSLSLFAATNLPLDSVRNLPSGPEIPARAVVPTVDSTVPMGGLWLDHCFGRRESVSALSGGPGEHRGGPSANDAGAGFSEAGMVGAETGAAVLARLLDANGNGVEIWADESFGWVQVFTADPARREGYPGEGRAVAVEPMTCPPNALRSGRDILTLQPGETRDFSLGIDALV